MNMGWNYLFAVFDFDGAFNAVPRGSRCGWPISLRLVSKFTLPAKRSAVICQRQHNITWRDDQIYRGKSDTVRLALRNKVILIFESYTEKNRGWGGKGFKDPWTRLLVSTLSDHSLATVKYREYSLHFDLNQSTVVSTSQSHQSSHMNVWYITHLFWTNLFVTRTSNIPRRNEKREFQLL